MTEEDSEKKWTLKGVFVGILMAISIGTTWILAKVAGPEAPPSRTEFTCATSQVVFEQKRRCGFVDLGELTTVEGLVIKMKTHADGDRSINVIPDPEFQRLLYHKGRRTRDYLHVEFMPCERVYSDVETGLIDVLKRWKSGVPTRVRITGRWAYDGVDHRGKWRDQLGNCLAGTVTDDDVGWTEIHPAYTVEIIE